MHAELVDLDHWRRATRLCPIFIDRFGLGFFVKDIGNGHLDEERLLRCTDLAAEWISRRSGRVINDDGRARIARLLRSLVVEQLRAGSLRVR